MPNRAPAPREALKSATVLFADLVGSTEMAERLEPELVRAVLGRYFAAMREVIERHGGTVEKFIGDAVMAVWGIPRTHEDDALRAVRAAGEMRDVQHALNDELDARYGVRLAVRTGVATGRVVAGDASQGHAFATGDTVSLAARLEQAAAPAEILLSPGTYELVRHAVRVEPVPALALKGKAAPVDAVRVLTVDAHAAARPSRDRGRLVGRDRELEILETALAETIRTRQPRRVVVLGAAGVGKSRLIAEFAGRAGENVRFLAGRCLPYGDAITYHPVAQILRAATAITADASLEDSWAALGELVVDAKDRQAVSIVLGLDDQPLEQERLFAAVRRTLAGVAARSAAGIVLVDDVQWASPTLVELIDFLTEESVDAPMLIVAVGRPELAEAAPALVADDPVAGVVTLDPLERAAAAELAVAALGDADAEVIAHVTRVAGGNPLFVEELAGMLVEQGLLARADGRWVAAEDLHGVALPSTIDAVLGARLDQLPPAERDLAERASIIGEEFWSGAVADLAAAAEPDAVAQRLDAMIDRRLLARGDDRTFADELPYRFQHLLIRDAAYERLLKLTRAELHERFAAWLAARLADRLPEHEAIVGHHLETAFRYRRELGPLDDHGLDVARRAAARLHSAGERAADRGDMRAALQLIDRALALPGIAPSERVAALLLLGWVLSNTGGGARLVDVLREAEAVAARSGDEHLHLRVRLELATAEWQADPFADDAALVELATRGAAVFKREGDWARWAHAAFTLSFTEERRGRYGRAAELLEEAADKPRALTVQCRVRRLFVLLRGPGAVGDVRAAAVDLLAATEPFPVFTVELLGVLAELDEMAGASGESRLAQARALLDDSSMGKAAVLLAGPAANLRVLRGQPAASISELRAAVEHFVADRDFFNAGEYAALLAMVLCEARDDACAAETLALARRSGANRAVWDRVNCDRVEALLAARAGDVVTGSAAAARAVALADASDALSLRADARMTLAEVLLRDGDDDAARQALRAAERLFERKGHVVGVRRARAELARVG